MNSKGVVFDGVSDGMARTEKYFIEEIQHAIVTVNNRVGVDRTLPSCNTAPVSSMTQTLVSLTDTSKPTNCPISCLLARQGGDYSLR